MSDFVGRTLGPYQILSEIGHGGMARVYRASQPSIGREVAIKILPYYLREEAFLERFAREITIIARLQHPRILPVYDSGETDGTPYIVMAYIQGGTLANRIKNLGNTMPLPEIIRIATQIAEGLDYAHEQGFVHLDFKPSNVLIDRKDNIYLADFGIARVMVDTGVSTGSGIFGTPHYMAPELSQGGKISPQADIYSLGVTLFEMVTGRPPYRGDTPIGIILAHATQPIPDARELRPRLPGAVQQVLGWALAKDPADRPASAGELVQLLERAMTIAGPDTAIVLPPDRERTLVKGSRRDASTHTEDDPESPGTIDLGDPAPMPEPNRPEGQLAKASGMVARLFQQTPLPFMLLSGGAALATIAFIGLALTSGVSKSANTSTQSAPTPTMQAVAATVTPVAQNADWTPVSRAFDGVDMVEVPPGCFMMGNDSGDNEKPAHRQCFDRPFWIDRTEVSNAQFTQFGGSAASPSQWTDGNLPRERISWVEAAAFCQKRSARLPTEVEWEYASRGPDGLVYPWGNDFDPNNTVFATNSGGQPAQVGSKPGGVSWVGALDMSGNVYEWVSSTFKPYPYQPDDGRENANDRTHTRVIRGGSWMSIGAISLTTSLRSGGDPLTGRADIGLRCARSN